jgi:hypothetical protein
VLHKAQGWKKLGGGEGRTKIVRHALMGIARHYHGFIDRSALQTRRNTVNLKTINKIYTIKLQ